jgi:hypothetical protein
MKTPTVYLLDSGDSATRCVRILLDAGVEPMSIGIHCWEPRIAIRVRSLIPDSAVIELAEFGCAPLNPSTGGTSAEQSFLDRPGSRQPAPRTRRRLWPGARTRAGQTD